MNSVTRSVHTAANRGAEEGMRILVINCGSISLKYKLYEAQEQDLSLLAAA